MKNWERLIVYFALVCAIGYGLWAHGKLEALYEINRNRIHRSTSFPPPSAPITCTDYTISVDQTTPEVWTFKWSAWAHNPNPYWVKGAYFVEFRNKNNSLLKLEVPIPGDFPPTKTPREANGLCDLSAYLAQQVDTGKSRVFILEEKK